MYYRFEYNKLVLKELTIYFERKLINMPANVESMFYVRETPWHGLGVKVEEALSSRY